MTEARTTKGAATSATDQNETNPLAIVAGGLALGIAVGALLPRSKKERELLEPVGKRIAESATAAIAAAREAGKAEIDTLLPQGPAARSHISKVLNSALSAAKEAGVPKTDA